MLDGDAATRWTTTGSQAPGNWIEVHLPGPRPLGGVELALGDRAAAGTRRTFTFHLGAGRRMAARPGGGRPARGGRAEGERAQPAPAVSGRSRHRPSPAAGGTARPAVVGGRAARVRGGGGALIRPPMRGTIRPVHVRAGGPLLTLANAAPAPAEMRGLWVVRTALVSPAGRRRGGGRGGAGRLQRAVRAGARPRRRLLRSSQRSRAATCSRGQPAAFDPLGAAPRARARARAAGARLDQRAALRGFGQRLPPDHVFARHPDWAMGRARRAPRAHRRPRGLPVAGAQSRATRRRRGRLPLAVGAGVGRHLEAVGARAACAAIRSTASTSTSSATPGPTTTTRGARSTGFARTRSLRATPLRARARSPRRWDEYRRDALTALAARLARAARAERPGAPASRRRWSRTRRRRSPEVPGLARLARARHAGRGVPDGLHAPTRRVFRAPGRAGARARGAGARRCGRASAPIGSPLDGIVSGSRVAREAGRRRRRRLLARVARGAGPRRAARARPSPARPRGRRRVRRAGPRARRRGERPCRARVLPGGRSLVAAVACRAPAASAPARDAAADAAAASSRGRARRWPG